MAYGDEDREQAEFLKKLAEENAKAKPANEPSKAPAVNPGDKAAKR